MSALWRRFVPRPSILVGFPPAAHRGLIFLYSKPETLVQAILHHQFRLEYLCLIVSDGSLELARETIEQLQEKRQLTSIQVREERIPDHWNPDETALAVERAIRQGSDLGLAKHDLICDVTGGTKRVTR